MSVVFQRENITLPLPDEKQPLTKFNPEVNYPNINVFSVETTSCLFLGSATQAVISSSAPGALSVPHPHQGGC